jgi:hypothetical protein
MISDEVPDDLAGAKSLLFNRLVFLQASNKEGSVPYTKPVVATEQVVVHLHQQEEHHDLPPCSAMLHLFLALGLTFSVNLKIYCWVRNFSVRIV